MKQQSDHATEATRASHAVGTLNVTAPDCGPHSDEPETRPMSRPIETIVRAANVGQMAGREGICRFLLKLNEIKRLAAPPKIRVFASLKFLVRFVWGRRKCPVLLAF
jgi:hypothetical protein